MKLIKLFLLMISFLVISKAQAVHQLYADIDGISIPYGTKLNLVMAQDVTTKAVAQGDSFQAYLAKDLYVNNKLVLPSKTIFRGRIANVKYSKFLSRPATLYLNLDHLVTTRGVQLPLQVGLATSFDYILKPDKGLTTNGNYFRAVRRDFKKSGQMVKKAVNWGASKDEEWFNGADYIIVPVAAVGSSVVCVCSCLYSTVADLFKHGDEIVLKKNAPFDIMLLSTLDIPY